MTRDRIELIKRINNGTYGEVYKVQINKEDFQALKFYFKFDEYISTMREVDILFRIKNPFLVKGYQLYSTRNYPEIFKTTKSSTALSEELLTGSLDDLENVNRMTALKMAIDISLALKCLSQAGYYHYDLTPANILFKKDKEGEGIEFYLADYGLCLINDENPTSVVGTYIYQDPQMLENINSDEVTYSTDYYCWMLAINILNLLSEEKWIELFSDLNPKSAFKELCYLKRSKFYLRESIIDFICQALNIDDLSSASDPFELLVLQMMGLNSDGSLNNRMTLDEFIKISDFKNKACEYVPVYQSFVTDEKMVSMAIQVFLLAVNKKSSYEYDYFEIFLALEYYLRLLTIKEIQKSPLEIAEICLFLATVYYGYNKLKLEAEDFFYYLNFIKDIIGWNPLAHQLEYFELDKLLAAGLVDGKYFLDLRRELYSNPDILQTNDFVHFDANRI